MKVSKFQLPGPKGAFALFVIVLMLACGGSVFTRFSKEMWTQATQLPTVEQRIGASISAPDVTLGGNAKEVILFSEIEAGSPAAVAGIMDGDIVIEDVSIGDLCRRFDGTKRGRQASVEIVSGGDGPPLDQRPQRRVTIILP